MAERLADSGELAVDELKRKARRRLVGAIVLALAAAIVVPMLLESEPRTLGDDVSVQIPPLDEGKFVNRLTGAAAEPKSSPNIAGNRDAKGSPPERDAKPTPTESDTKQAPRPEADGMASQQSALPGPAAAPAAPSTQSTGAAPETQSAKAVDKSLSNAEQRVLVPAAKPVTKPALAQNVAEPKQASEPKSATADKGMTTPTAPASSANEFVVQLAAFADDKGANALANKLKRADYAAYVEPVTTSRGTLWRVRVGSFASRSDADAARVKLKDEGYSGIVAPAK